MWYNGVEGKYDDYWRWIIMNINNIRSIAIEVLATLILFGLGVLTVIIFYNVMVIISII